MKKFFFSMMAMLAFAGSAMAQGPKIVIDEVIVTDNEDPAIDFNFEFDKADYYGNFQMDVILPEGVSVIIEDDAIAVDLNNGRNKPMNGFSMSANEVVENGVKIVRFIAANLDGKSLKGTSGTLFTLPIEIAENMPNGTLKGKVTNILINANEVNEEGKAVVKDFKPEDVDFDIVISLAVGINEVQAEGQQGTVYNLNGQRVQKAQKGLYIENGKKVVKK